VVLNVYFKDNLYVSATKDALAFVIDNKTQIIFHVKDACNNILAAIAYYSDINSSFDSGCP
jgi:hypothetical protein